MVGGTSLDLMVGGTSLNLSKELKKFAQPLEHFIFLVRIAMG
jgi:hypothetical protein